MGTIIEIMASIGVAASLIKFADLLLGEGVKKFIQSKFETLTLVIDDLDPICWFRALSRPRPALAWSIFAGLTAWLGGPAILGGAIAALLDLWIMSGVALLDLEIPFPMSDLALGYLAAFPLSAFAIWRLSPRLVIWLTSCGISQFLFRLLIFYLSTLLVFTLFYFVSGIASNYSISKWLMLVIWPFMFGGYVVNVSALLLLWLLVILVPIKIYTKAIAFLCWRVVQYSGGVMSALFIISTAMFAVTRALIERDMGPDTLIMFAVIHYLPSLWAAADIVRDTNFTHKVLWIVLVLFVPIPGQVIWHGTKESRGNLPNKQR